MTTIQEVETRVCSICETTKPINDFYRNDRSRGGRMAHCIACNNQRPPTMVRICRNRARSRAVAILAQRHADEYEALYQEQYDGALREHEQLQAAAAGNPDAEHARLRPGPVREGESKLDRLDVARCVRCHTHHDAEHECPSCGGITPEKAPAMKPWEIRQWAQAEGIDVPGRGPLPVRVVQAYGAAHAAPAAVEVHPPFDEAAVVRALNSDRSLALTRADRIEVVRRAREAGWSFLDIERRTSVTKPERYIIRENQEQAS